ncbi:MAG TPA: VOC family protein [Actinomycetota bacterium]|nr:VOC family protein [Actinomycetota bacterium]
MSELDPHRPRPGGHPAAPVLHGGNATVMVTEMDRAVDFYVDTLGLVLAFRAGGDWAMIAAGEGLTIGLHSSAHGGPEPGTVGGISIGFSVSPPIEAAVETLEGRGVQFAPARGGGVISDQGFVKLAFFADPDGNPLYLAEMPTRRQGTGATKPLDNPG